MIRWLQVGYPQGVPGPDQVPLLALLRSTPLTPEQLKEVVANLTADGSDAVADGKIDGNEIAEKISELTHHDAGTRERPAGGRHAGRGRLAAGRHRRQRACSG